MNENFKCDEWDVLTMATAVVRIHTGTSDKSGRCQVIQPTFCAPHRNRHFPDFLTRASG